MGQHNHGWYQRRAQYRRFDMYLLNCLHWVLLRPGKEAALCPDCGEVKPVIHTIERWRA